MTKWKIYNEDAVEWARNYQKGKFHALLCDPPYHLTSIVKRFGKKGSAPAKHGTDGVFSRSSKGFMGQQWDGGDIAFRPETWAAFGEVLYPGAFGMAFSASRNWHRLAVAIEDAGFIIHPTIFLWAQGQGFPKATNISKQIQPASEQKKVGKYKLPNGQDWNLKQAEDKSVEHVGGTFTGSKTRTLDILEPTDEMAARWVGHRYGLQALKPAVEPIIVFQKPYEGKPLSNIVETGAGALNIDGGRIPVNGENVIINRFTDGAKPWGNGAGHEYDTESTQQGRWPSNLILDGTAEALDKQTGITTSGRVKESKPAYDGESTVTFLRGNSNHQNQHGDSGGASRFFYNVSQQLDENDPVYYCGKVSPKERNAGLDDSFEEKPAYEYGSIKKSEGRTGINTPNKNHHPTLKPIDLARYLATLLLPPAEYGPRRLFVPFSGVGSEMIGAGLAGWEHIVGVEFDKENGYVDIAQKRLEYWLRENK